MSKVVKQAKHTVNGVLVKNPHDDKCYIGWLSAADIIKLANDGILSNDDNIRNFEGSKNSCNKKIKETAETQPEEFHRHNNGIYLGAEGVEIRNDGKITLHGNKIQLENGMQTTSTLRQIIAAASGGPAEKIILPAKVVVAENEAQRQTYCVSANTQTNNKLQNFTSHDPQMRALAEKTLTKYNIWLVTKGGDDQEYAGKMMIKADNFAKIHGAFSFERRIGAAQQSSTEFVYGRDQDKIKKRAKQSYYHEWNGKWTPEDVKAAYVLNMHAKRLGYDSAKNKLKDHLSRTKYLYYGTFGYMLDTFMTMDQTTERHKFAALVVESPAMEQLANFCDTVVEKYYNSYAEREPYCGGNKAKLVDLLKLPKFGQPGYQNEVCPELYKVWRNAAAEIKNNTILCKELTKCLNSVLVS